MKIDGKDDFLLVETMPKMAYHYVHLSGAINLPPDEGSYVGGKSNTRRCSN